MENAQLIALSRQHVLRNRLDVVANNMANINTPGFKSQDLHFSEYVMAVAENTAFEPQDRKMSYVDMFTTRTNFDPGSVMTTGNDLDFALNSEGFFVVQLEDGTEAYTRAGSFHLNAQGQLVAPGGLPVLTDQGPVTITREDGLVEVSAEGIIATDNGIRGRLRVVNFEDLRKLEKIGDTLFVGEDPIPATDVRMIQGAVEGSNVFGVTEVSRLIEVTRAYESMTNLLKEIDDLRQQAVRTLGTFEG
ncbi:flagellar basal-body rod protein FlgF [Labrenzia sp. PHM005]|uniref:flagellar basal-body rod protein FlgF n=1 Tax=Labrenzia sp. PHM005 TaxID=2590016 RepID=UPI00114061D1|nr:flagellar basal-body rod protein FlgF [Labrenzia sp. PHM005]QDG76817.1 flagellar basal-body rod protein FlgF [Labrenzia sp. PHM005]